MRNKTLYLGNWRVLTWIHEKLVEMAQRGILSFFSPSGGSTNKKKKKSDSQSTPSKKRKEREEDGADVVSSPKGPVLDSSESPVLKSKSKRRRVIMDSDSDTEKEDVMMSGDVGVTEVKGCEGEEAEVCEDVQIESENVNEGDGETQCQDESMTENTNIDVKTNGQVSTEQLLSPVRPSRVQQIANGDDNSTEIVRTPPKRTTARKHTGKRSSKSLYSATSSSSSRSKGRPSPKKRKVDNTDAAFGEEVSNGEGTQNGGDGESFNCKEPHDTNDETKEGNKDFTEPQESSTIESDDMVTSMSTESTESSSSTVVTEKLEKAPSDMDGESSNGVSTDKKKATHQFFASRTPKKSSKRSSKKEVASPSQGSSPKSSVKSSPGAKVSSPLAAGSVPGKGGGKKTTDIAYNPAKTDYHPVDDACWKKGEKIPYLAIAKTFERIEEESKRLKIVSILTNFLRSVVLLSPSEMVQCVYLCLNKLAPAYEGLELGIGESLLMKAIAGATGRKVDQIKEESIEKGDLGIVAETSRSTQRMMFAPPKLTVKGVYGKLKEIASMSGSASMSKKVDIIKGLIVACRKSEARYLIRSLGGKLRIGLAEQSVLTAIGHAVVFSPPGKDWPVEVVDASTKYSSEEFQKLRDEAALKVKTCYCEHPNYDALLPALITHGVNTLSDHCPLTPGIPLKPMLAHPTKGIQEVLKRFEGAEFTCEWKYDGERAQIHVLGEGRGVKVYSRNSENNTSKYPDIIARMSKVLKDTVQSCVIDAEAVAWDTDKKQILPFQILSTRKRKDTDISEVKVQVCVFAFDLIFLNGKSLVREPFKVRRELLKSSFNQIEGEFVVAQSMDTDNIEQIQEFMDESIKGNCEGLMVKTLDKAATYEIARRSHNWLKLKKDYLEGVGDTLDLVVVGGFHGSGKRTGKYGGFLLACYDDENEEFQVICKIGTGFKDEELTQHTEFFKNHILEKPKPYYRYNDNGVIPDHWFDSVRVWEVKAADLSISPVYTAGAGIADPEKGISLRFPRFLRIRDDKKPEEATTSRQVADMYKSQQNIVKATGSSRSHDPEDFY